MQSRISIFPRRCALAVAVSCAFASPASAQQMSSTAPDAKALDEVVVTASRTPQTQDAALVAMTVITREDIERRAPLSLSELLRGQPGLAIASNGGPGKVASAFLRGTDSDHLVVLVDGVRIGSVTSGGAAFQDIPVEQVERIEIVRGPFSSLYGADAVGGVIQVFTRRPRKGFAANASAGAGSFDTRRASAGISGRSGAPEQRGGWYALQAAYERTDGINAYRDDPSHPFDDFTLDPDRDGYENRSLSLSGGRRFSAAWDVEARALRSEGNNRYDGWNDESDIVQQVLGGKLRYAPHDRLRVTLDLGRADDLSDNYTAGVPNGHFDSHRTTTSLQADVGIGAGVLTVGHDWRRDEVDTDPVFDRDRRINRGLFGQWQQDIGAHALQASLRRDEDDQFGGRTTGSVLWGWSLRESLRVTASYGTAYKAPTFNDLYYPFSGNPALAPETSRSAAVGLRGEHGWGEWRVDVFETRVDDLIAWDATPAPDRPFGMPRNIDRARIRGAELTLSTAIAGWTVAANATLLDARDDSARDDGDGDGVNDGNLLPRRSRTGGRIDVDRDFGALQLGATVNVLGERYDDPANTRRLPGHGTTDLRFGYAMTGAWTLQLNAYNVFDKGYETVMFYPQPGRHWFLGLRYSPQ